MADLLPAEELRDPHRRSLAIGLLGSLVVLLALGAASILLPCDLAHATSKGPAGPAVLLAVVLGAQLFLPLTGLFALAIVALGRLAAAIWAGGGALIGAALGWAIGRYWIGGRVERLARPESPSDSGLVSLSLGLASLALAGWRILRIRRWACRRGAL